MPITERVLQRSRTVIGQIRLQLAEQAPSYPDLETLAGRLCVTSRTLKRHLIRGGLRFQDLLDQMRHAHAVRLLEQPELSVEEIAERVGYASAASFHRAFRRWTGLSPGAFRGGPNAAPLSPSPAPGVASGRPASRPQPPAYIPA